MPLNDVEKPSLNDVAKDEKFSVILLNDVEKPSLKDAAKDEKFSVMLLNDVEKLSLNEVVKDETFSVVPLNDSLIDAELFLAVTLADSLTADKADVITLAIEETLLLSATEFVEED